MLSTNLNSDPIYLAGNRVPTRDLGFAQYKLCTMHITNSGGNVGVFTLLLTLREGGFQHWISL